jgi:hypothetical protein
MFLDEPDDHFDGRGVELRLGENADAFRRSRSPSGRGWAKAPDSPSSSAQHERGRPAEV